MGSYGERVCGVTLWMTTVPVLWKRCSMSLHKLVQQAVKSWAASRRPLHRLRPDAQTEIRLLRVNAILPGISLGAFGHLTAQLAS